MQSINQAKAIKAIMLTYPSPNLIRNWGEILKAFTGLSSEAFHSEVLKELFKKQENS